MTPKLNAQQKFILQELRRREWYSLGDSLNSGNPIYALSQRIGEMKKCGYDIHSRRVKGHPYYEYKLVSEPKNKLMVKFNHGTFPLSEYEAQLSIQQTNLLMEHLKEKLKINPWGVNDIVSNINAIPMNNKVEVKQGKLFN